MNLIKCFTEEFHLHMEEGSDHLPRVKIEASVVLAENEEVTVIESDNIKYAINTACEKYITQKKGGAK